MGSSSRKGDFSGIDSQGPLFYAWDIVAEESMAGKTSARKTKTRKPAKSKRSAQGKSAVNKEMEDSMEIRENRSETFDPLAYFAKYFDQI